MKYTTLSQRPFKVKGSRVRRTYSGGKLLETWHNDLEPLAGVFPEEWVASIVQATNAGREDIVV